MIDISDATAIFLITLNWYCDEMDKLKEEA